MRKFQAYRLDTSGPYPRMLADLPAQMLARFQAQAFAGGNYRRAGRVMHLPDMANLPGGEDLAGAKGANYPASAAISPTHSSPTHNSGAAGAEGADEWGFAQGSTFHRLAQMAAQMREEVLAQSGSEELASLAYQEAMKLVRNGLDPRTGVGAQWDRGPGMARSKTGARPSRWDPQPLARVTEWIIRREGWGPELEAAKAIEQWPQIVGEDLAAHSQVEEFRDGRLYVRADSAWATQLEWLRPSIEKAFFERLGQGVVKQIIIRKRA